MSDLENVVAFPGVKSIIQGSDETEDRPSAETILELAKKDLETALVLGWTPDGKFFLSSSSTDGGELLWLMELARKVLTEPR